MKHYVVVTLNGDQLELLLRGLQALGGSENGAEPDEFARLLSLIEAGRNACRAKTAAAVMDAAFHTIQQESMKAQQ